VNASLSDVTGLALDTDGNLYIADAGNRRIRKVTTDGIISTIAGTGVQGFSGDGGAAINAQLNRPTSVLFSGGSLYIADSSNQRIRQVNSTGGIRTLAGNGVAGFSGDGGAAISASLQFPLGMAMDSLGNLYFADGDNNRVRQIRPDGTITTVAGDGPGRYAGDQGPASSASLNIPFDVAVDGAGNLLIADAGNNRVRKVDTSGFISTVAGSGVDGFSGDGGLATEAILSFPWGLTTDAAGNVYIADRVNNRVRIVSVTPPPPANNSTPDGAL
jgi:sugar lactone lactonase YvrE